MFGSRWRISLVVLVLMSLILAACGGTPATDGTTGEAPAAATTPDTGAAATTPDTGTGATAAETATTATDEAGGETATAETAGTDATAEGGEAVAEAEPTPPPPTLTPGPGAVVLEYWEMDWGFQQVLQDLVTQFNQENPNIYVKMTQLEWGDYMQKLTGAIAAGEPPDISGGDGGMPFNFHAQGQALPLDELYTKWKSDGRFEDFTQWNQDKWFYDGTYVGVSWQIDPRAIFYRKSMFEAAGITPPTTHDELLAAATKLTDPSKEQYGICVPGKQGSYDTDQFYMTLVLQNGGGLADEQGNPTFDTPEHLEALRFEQELVAAAAPPGTPSYDFGQLAPLYQQGHCAMIFEGGWFIGQLEEEAPEVAEDTAILPPLTGRGPNATQRIVGFYNPWMIYNQTEHPEEAMQFLDFMMQQENLREVYASVRGKGSVYKSLRNDPLYQENEMTAELARQVEEFAVDYWYPNNVAAVGIGSLGTGITDTIVNPVLAGAREPEDALRDAQEQLGPIFQRQQ